MVDSNVESLLPDDPHQDCEAQPTASPSRDVLRSVTRLIIGGVEVGLDEFLRQLAQWEEKAAAHIVEPPQAAGELILEAGDDPTPTSDKTEAAFQDAASERDLLRWALIGMVFDTQARLRAGAVRLRQVERAAFRLARPLIRPAMAVTNSPLLTPIWRGCQDWAQRGEQEVARWIELGQAEEMRSRALAEAAFNLTVDEYIEYLTHNPQVQELVQQQSTGLATEVIEEVRERTVSADTFLEGLARSLLRRAPRTTLPRPPEPVRQSALSMRRVKRDDQRGVR